MSTPFIDDVANGDVIEPVHVNQYAGPINKLESGDTWYREATNTSNAYKVSFAAGNVVSSYTKGLIVHFKAPADNTGAATLTITGPSGDLSAIDLVKKGGDALDAGDISNGQMIAVIYTEDAGATNKRFEVLGGLSSGGGLTSPVGVADGGTGATTAGGARTTLDVPSNSDLTTGLAGKADASHTHAASDITSGNLSVARGGTGAGTASGALATLGAQAQDDTLDEISTLSMAKGDILIHNGSEITKLSPGSNGQVLAADSAEATGLKWVVAGSGGGGLTSPVGVTDGGTGATTASNARTNLDVPSQSDLTTGLAGKANSSHTHNASEITSGSLGLARGGTAADLSATGGAGQVLKQSTSGGAISVSALGSSDIPVGIDAAKIGGGAVSNTEFGYLDGATSSIQTQLNGKASSTHTHAAGTDLTGQAPVANGGTGLSTMTASGRLLYSSSASALATLAAGSNGQVLTVVSGLPAWVTPTAAESLAFITCLSGKNTSTTSLQTIATSSALAAGTYLLRFSSVTILTAESGCNVLMAYRINSGSDVYPHGTDYVMPGSFSMLITVSANDTISLRCKADSTNSRHSVEVFKTP